MGAPWAFDMARINSSRRIFAKRDAVVPGTECEHSVREVHVRESKRWTTAADVNRRTAVRFIGDLTPPWVFSPTSSARESRLAVLRKFPHIRHLPTFVTAFPPTDLHC